MSTLGALEPIGISPLLISIRVLIPLINNMMTSDRCRTVVVSYNNDTSDIANEALRAIDTFRDPVVSANVDLPKYAQPNDSHMGSHLFNICIMKNISGGPRQNRMLELVLHMRNYQFIILLEKARADEISVFFKRLWTAYKMSNVAAFFLGETVEVYTHFPYQNRFAVKVDEFHVSEPSLPANSFSKYFNGKVSNLQEAKVNICMSENYPKTFNTPPRYRYMQENFYFLGRDGLTVQGAQVAFNVQWQYKTLPSNLPKNITPFEFGDDTRNINVNGQAIAYSQFHPNNFEFVILRKGEPIS